MRGFVPVSESYCSVSVVVSRWHVPLGLAGDTTTGKKTTNFDAMRDLNGRRIRHVKAVERIKEWLEKKKKEDELVTFILRDAFFLVKMLVFFFGCCRCCVYCIYINIYI